MTRMTEARTKRDPLTRLATGRFGRAYRRGVAVALRPAYGIYERRLSAAVMALPRPKHVAVIMDGNRRWATAEGYEDLGVGHRRGAEKALEIIDWCADLGIWEVTLWALSLENLGRPEDGGRHDHRCRGRSDRCARRAGDVETRVPIDLRVIGRRDLLPGRPSRRPSTRSSVLSAPEGTMRVTIALAYRGRDELLEAFRATVRDAVAAGDGSRTPAPRR